MAHGSKSDSSTTKARDGAGDGAPGFDRDLLRGSLDMMILSVLADGPKYGYLIQKQIRDASGQHVDLPAGTMYPLLHKLESKRLVCSRWESDTGRRRKWYELTAAGRRRLDQQALEWQRYAECIRALLGPVTGTRPKPA